MMLLVWLTLVFGLYECAEDSIDGNLLSNELKKFKQGIGVDYIQNEFNRLPFVTKTETGNQLLSKIQTSLDQALKDLQDVLENVKSTKNNNADRDTISLAKCCEKTGNYKYIPEFRKEVDFSKACVTISPNVVPNLLYPPSEISDAMKSNYEKNRNVLWQRYSTTKGVSIVYPSTYWNDCDNYDPRFTSSYAATASPKDKDVVIVLDTSSSMKQPSGVQDKTKIVIAKEAANNVIQTLKPNDRVGIVRFDIDASTPSGGCYQNQLAFATKVNTDKTKAFVFDTSFSTNSGSDFEKALIAAFNFFSNNTQDLESRDQVILFISDGISTGGINPVQVIADKNKYFQNKVMIFTYLLGEDNDAKVQMQQMANQYLSDLSFGQIKAGKFQNFAQGDQKFLSTVMATFYVNIPTDSSATATFTVPYVDVFSRVGLITSYCLPVNDISGLHGVACTDVKLSELLTEVEYFSEEEYSYAFLIDGNGRALMHPLLPDAAYVKFDEKPVLIDIGVLEREAQNNGVLESMKRSETGSKTFSRVFTKPRGRLVNDGSSYVSVTAKYFWGAVPHSNFSLCVVIVDDSYSEIKESDFTMSSEDLNSVFMYHNRSLLSDNYRDCKFYKRRVTLDRSCVKFSPSAFSNPFQYLDREETAEDVAKYSNYLAKKYDTNPGFKATIRSSVWATYKAEQFWKSNPARYVAWRYIGTKAGLIRIYPGVSLLKSYDHQKRAWWRQTLAHPNTMFLTSPYVDAWGSGIVLSFTYTIFKKNSTQVTAVVGADFPLEYFSWFISNVYPSCDNGYSCIIVDDSGFIVMHPRLKETTDESQFIEPKHITVEEPGIAEKLKSNSVLNVQECQDFSANINLHSYRITLPPNKLGGLGFQDTDNSFELRPISETNLFIIRVKKTPPNFCPCDASKSPDAVPCSSSCYCLCYISIVYDVCSNRYDTRDASLPCSARLPDTSGISEPDKLVGLKTCYDVTCHQQENKKDCLSEAECSWCEYTDLGLQITTPCCRLKEECSFGKTKSNNRNTCALTSITQTTPDHPRPDASQDSTEKTAGIVGGSVVAGILLTLLFIGGIYYCRHYRYTADNTDPYIDAIPDRNELDNYIGKEGGSNESMPPPYTSNPNYYVESGNSNETNM